MDLAVAFDVVTGAAWLALGVVLLRMCVTHRDARLWLLLGAGFSALRAFDSMLVSTGEVDATWVVRTLDAAVLATLLGLVFGVARLGRDLSRKVDDAEHAEAEYGRALLDYTQLVRHRIANPLTAVKGGIQTLLDLPLEEAIRRQMLEAMLESARQLERVALHPEQVGAEEGDLRPTPAPLADEDAMRSMRDQGGHVEADFRDVNRELIDVVGSGGRRTIVFVCECSARDCSSPISMSLDDYYSVHGDGAQFIVVPNHDLPAIEDVVRREADWWVVKKRGKPARDARRRA